MIMYLLAPLVLPLLLIAVLWGLALERPQTLKCRHGRSAPPYPENQGTSSRRGELLACEGAPSPQPNTPRIALARSKQE